MYEKRKDVSSRPRFKFGTPNSRQGTIPAHALFAESRTQSFGEVLKQQNQRTDLKQLRDLQENVSKISQENEALMRKKNEEENKSKSIRELSILLNDYYHKNISVLEFKNENEITPEITDNMVKNYNNFIKTQISQLPQTNIISERIHSIEETSNRLCDILLKIDEKKKCIESPQSEETAQFISEQIKRKHRYLKKQYDELDEFLRIEVEAKKKKDWKTIGELESAQRALNTELNITKQKLLEQRINVVSGNFDNLLNQLSILESKRKEKEDLVVDLTAQNASLQKQIEIAKNRIEMLTLKRDSFTKLKQSLVN